jgi:uncharacterized protein YdhG (YjbR/CyaY superfamily)
MAATGVRSVDEYIAGQPGDVRPILERVRRAIRRGLPGAEEGIGYQIPCYRLNGRVVLYFAGWTRHFSLYPAGDRLVAELGDEISAYEISKGTIRFPLSHPVPARLIERIARFRAKEHAAQAMSVSSRGKRRG